ncbi:HsdM family class I SAM-dependent methyltransferase [Methylobacterium radiotolerans]|uniref:HsdM family class I SAM-dependent methyltransferase n=1 Tax=Methylobacterium radiotolerans TaxID=31998 RepID=UPI001F326A6E|nr:N-6 DNA methylase [Methylobacterium radiotolerans]UIY44207.1 SAM-dependent methyltransferase [Methylobacterium radiotolerans]
MTDLDIVDAIAVRQGLARAPLFRRGETQDADAHSVWLDGRHGSFLLSVSGRDEARDAASWAWSSGMPHHVGIVGDAVTVVRWDEPGVRRRFDRRRVLDDPDAFYAHLREDRVRSRGNIVAHCLATFRRVRNLGYHRGLEDVHALDAYLALLAALCSSPHPDLSDVPALAAGFDLPEGAADLLGQLPRREVEAIVEGFLGRGMEVADTRALPRLAIRHASGDVFQEAHFELLSRAGPDLFAETPPAGGRKPSRGGVHFTPPYLARSLAEEAIKRLGDLSAKPSLTVMDIACGSGAFLVETLRALERRGYAGHVRIVGRDTSLTAVHMARFVVGVALREWPGAARSSADIALGDSLRDDLPDADVVVVNPPFATGRDIAPDVRSEIRGLLGLSGGHLDLSMAFVLLATRRIRPGGAMAAIMPAKLLEADKATPWRRSLVDGFGVALTAVFSDIGLFEHAAVRIGALVLVRGEVDDAVHIRTGPDKASVGEALRSLRGWRNDDGTSPPADWEVGRGRFGTQAHGDEIARRTRPMPVASPVTDLFDVRMGIRTGGNRVFVRTDAELAQLPPEERRLYQRAVTTKGIHDGRVTRHVHVFYPYRDGKHAFSDEDDVRKAAPVTFARYLEPARERLRKRRDHGHHWWELTIHSPLLLRTPPALVSKYFSKPGGFTVDPTGRCAVLQGFGWVPKGRLAEAMRPGETTDMTAAYLAVLNSNAFFDEVSRAAPRVRGGQFDMSSRHMASVPLCDLTRYPEAVPDLAGFARNRYLSGGCARAMSEAEVEAWTAEKLAQARSGRVFPAHGPVSSDDLPRWARWLAMGPSEDAPAVRYVDVIEHLQGILDAGEAAEVDGVLRAVDPGRMSEQSLITLVRTTFGYRSRLPGWSGFRDRVAAELETRGRPAQKILVGLYA